MLYAHTNTHQYLWKWYFVSICGYEDDCIQLHLISECHSPLIFKNVEICTHCRIFGSNYSMVHVFCEFKWKTWMQTSFFCIWMELFFSLKIIEIFYWFKLYCPATCWSISLAACSGQGGDFHLIQTLDSIEDFEIPCSTWNWNTLEYKSGMKFLPIVSKVLLTTLLLLYIPSTHVRCSSEIPEHLIYPRAASGVWLLNACLPSKKHAFQTSLSLMPLRISRDETKGWYRAENCPCIFPKDPLKQYKVSFVQNIHTSSWKISLPSLLICLLQVTIIKQVCGRVEEISTSQNWEKRKAEKPKPWNSKVDITERPKKGSKTVAARHFLADTDQANERHSCPFQSQSRIYWNLIQAVECNPKMLSPWDQ